MSGDHDLGYKQLFAHPALVRDLLSAFTSFDCFRAVDVAAFERVNASYVSEQYCERHGDMVWRIRVAGHVIYIYLLLEFQSQAERWMALRMQVYVGLLYQDIVKRHELADGQRLPPVLPLVLYNGAAPWNASGELRELVAPAPAGLEQFQASQRYLLIDQNRMDPDELAKSRSMVAALFRFELTPRAHVLKEAAATLRAWASGPEQASLRRSIATWIARLMRPTVDDVTIEEIESLLEGGAMGERFLGRFATIGDFLVDEGLQRGLAQGREEGREEGRRAMRSVLKRQLAKRFGEIPAAVLTRIDAAAESELERWSERILDAESLDAVLAN